MKTIILILLLIPFTGFCQNITDSLYFGDNNIANKSLTKSFTAMLPDALEFHNISILGESNHDVLNIDIKGDSLIVSENLKYNKAAILFMDAFRQVFYGKMDSLNNEIRLKDKEIKRLRNGNRK